MTTTTNPAQSELLLLEHVEQYAKARRLLRSTTIRGYRLAANSLGHFHGRPIRLAELTSTLLDEWAKSLLEAGFSGINAEVMRRHIEAVWRAAHADGLVDNAPVYRYRRGRALHPGVKKALDGHLLYNDLKPATQDYYRRMALVFSNWAADDPARQFNAETVSEFIRDKQITGSAAHYVKTLRHSLKTLLTQIGDTGRVRKIKVPRLNIAVWREPEIAALLAAIPQAVFPLDDSFKALARRHYFRTIILAAWYSGLSYSDLVELDASHVDMATGHIDTHRLKTDARVVTWIPPAILDEVAYDGPFWKPPTGPQQFRNDFGRIVTRAGLKGAFKKLRKSSGTRADELQPGRGHVHLGNSRRVFETYYQGADVHIEPIKVPAPAQTGGAA